MNQQKVNNLIIYFKQNPNIPLEQLINNCLKAGYPQEDINEAVNILKNQTVPSNDIPISSTPLQPDIPATNPSASPSNSNNISLITAIVLIVAVILIGIGIGFYITLSGKNIDLPFFTGRSIKPFPIQNIPSPTGTSVTAAPSKMITGAPISISDPLKAFGEVFTPYDYKISTSGKVEDKETKTDEKGNPYTSSSAMDFNNVIVYVQKGSVVRVENNDPQKMQVVFLKADKIYSLDPEKKTYSIINTSDEMGKFFLPVLKSSFPLIALLEDQKTTPFTWEKSGDSQWQTNWKFKNALSPGEEKPVRIKITLDPATNLIGKMSYLFKDDQSWQDATFSYGKITNIESLLTPPPDFTEKKSQP